ncbi:MAG: GntR family transcriptional regulator [Acidobacteriota bacterium]
MDIIIDLDASEPLFNQLIDQIKQAVRSGRLRPGDALPSIRQLAGDLTINSKTVAKAYKRLERDAVLQTRGYRGTFVHPDAARNSTVDLPALATTRLSATIDELRQAGVTDSEIRVAFGALMHRRNA